MSRRELNSERESPTHAAGSSSWWSREGSSLAALVEAQAIATPEALAIADDDERLTYGELNARATQLAAWLGGRGVGPEVVVGLCAPRSCRQVVGALGVLKAGGAYLPLDPDHPVERLAYTLADSRVEVLLTSGPMPPGLEATAERFDLATGFDALGTPAGPRPGVPVSLESSAYVIYTSGSTGRPKGTVIPQRGVLHLVDWYTRTFGLGPGDRATLVASPAFDASVFETWPALVTGASLLVPPPGVRNEPAALYRWFAREAVTVAFLPTPLAEVMMEEEPPPGLELRLLLVGGDRLHRPPRPGLPFRLINNYGPTEDSVASTSGEAQPAAETATGAPTIGRPLPGKRLSVVDPKLELVATGDPGELLIAGPGLARGYLARPGLTAERFVPDPFATAATPGGRVYRTGDLVRLLPGGELEFSGRLDHQVKIRGFRIELGEIECQLTEVPGVRGAVVVALPGGNHLAAYLVGAADDEAGLRAHLGGLLPEYMVPSHFVWLEKFPLLPTGKVDRKALVALAAETEWGGGDDDPDASPRSDTEVAMAALWAKLLGRPRVGVHDNLFALGGHSLLVAQLTARIRSTFGVDVGLREIHEHPTVAGISALIDEGAAIRRLPPFRRAPRDRPAPLSFPQERVWFLNELAPGNVAYNSQATITFDGPLAPRTFQRVLTEIVRRHEVFRTRFPAVDGSPVQIVDPPMPIPLPLIDLEGLGQDLREIESERLVYKALEKPFDLLVPPLARWSLVRHARERHVLIQVEHHFVHDGWSFGVLLSEMKALYTAFVAGQASSLPEPAAHCMDFAAWQREWIQGEVLEEFLDYFTRSLEGSPAALDLPTDFPRPPMQSFRGDAVRVDVPAELAEGLRQLARSTGTTLFTAMFAGFKTLLWRYSGQRDLLVGSAAANRRLAEFETMLGMAVNTLVLRTRIAPRQPFAELMRDLRAHAVATFVYQDMPLDQLIKRLDPERDLSRNPLFQVMFSFHDSPVPAMDFAGLRGRIFERHNGSAKSDLNVVGIPRAEQRLGQERRPDLEAITLLWEYCVDLFERSTMERMVRHYFELLASAVANPRAPLAELSMLGAAERAEIETMGRGRTLAPPPGLLHQLFEAAAERFPAAPAVTDGERGLSYAELESRANQLARWLRRNGVGPEAIVALAMPRSLELVVGALAVLKAGGAYLPLDPEHPADRLVFTLEDSGAPVILTAGTVRPEDLPPGESTAARLHLDLVHQWSVVAGESCERLASGLRPENRAYVIYTSGSTGRPKGTEIPHRGAVNLVAWHVDTFAVTADDRATLVASPAFDASVWEVWPYLAAGAGLVVAPAAARTNPAEMVHFLAAAGVTIAFLPTPLAEAMLEEDLPAGLELRTLLVGGDRLGRAPRAGLPFTLVNNYGPTEDSVVTTSAAVPAQPTDRPPAIGHGLPNKRLEVLDATFARVPVKVPGELLIAGDGLARGYLGRPGLTAERFVPDPLAGARVPGSRLYKTGDRVRWAADGQLEFLGRIDQQVKVRGYRIELGEIENRLLERDGVRAAVVVPLPGGNTLGAFLVVDGQPPAPAELHAALAAQLPEYMVPVGFTVIPALPVSPTGKIDRRALARQAAEQGWGGEPVVETRPRTETENVLALVWANLLGLGEVGAHENFFALGGHSLLATRVIARVRDAFGVELQVRTVFEAPTVAQLAARIDAALAAGAGVGEAPLVVVSRTAEPPMSFAQERLWFLDKLIAHPAAYHVARAWQLAGPLALGALAAAVDAVVARHESLRTSFDDRGGRPVQRIAAALRLPLPVVDLTALAHAEAASWSTRLREREARRPFDLGRLPLVRLCILRLAPDLHQLLLTKHHVVTDGISTGILLRDLGSAYAAQLAGGAAAFEPLPFHYADFAAWQRRSLEGEPLERLLAYWRKALQGAPRVLELPLDRPRPSLQSFRGEMAAITVPPAVAATFRQRAGDAGATWFMALLGAWAAFLGRISGQSEVVVGTPVAGRERRELEGIVGLFVNTLALRLGFAGDPTVVDFLHHVREVTLGGLAHQALPLERLVAELAPDRDLSHAPVFQTLLVPGDPSMDTLALAGLAAEPIAVRRAESQFDLALFVREDDAGLELALRYDTALFESTTARRMARQLACLLTAMANEPTQRISELPLLSAAERQALLLEWNDTAKLFPDRSTLHGLFASQALRQPEAVAVATPGGTLTYGGLEARANRLAHLLRELGAGPGQLVGVHLSRREEMVVAVLGVLKSGAAYVPLESTWPAERCRWIIEKKGIGILVTQSHRLPALDAPRPLVGLRHAVCLDVGALPAGRPILAEADLARQSSDPPVELAGPQDLAYIIFTSGSTGTPKGVMVRHRPVVNLIDWVNTTFRVGPGDRLLYTTALSFDLSVYDVFGMLAAGGTVRLASEAELEDPLRLVQILGEEPITFWDSAPAALVRLVPLLPNGALSTNLRLVFLSGDWIPVGLPDRVRRSFPGARVVSLGGATEATIWSNVFEVGEVDPAWSSIPYGRPIQNGRYHVLDHRLEPCPIGVPGDLFIGGDVLSTGYAAEPILTARQYLPDPFAAGSGAGSRLYKTGDRARFWADGVLEFLGRRDSQVKLRGYRIELGEIEAVLAEDPRLREVVVLVREDVPGDQRLVAYCTSDEADAGELVADLRRRARSRLPEYMVPAAFVKLESWPLTPTGKLDRKALPSPEQAQRKGRATQRTPRNHTEEVIAAVWREVIGIEVVNREDNFFDLGGHSLLIARVHRRLEEELGRSVAMADLFRHPSVATLAQAFAEEGATSEIPALAESVGTREAATSTAIAIVGMAGRFAAAGDVAELWRSLREGRELIRFFSEEELLAAGVPAEELADPRYVRARGALDEADRFDAAFFEIPPREAEIIDPQHRVFLETAWQALEDAGHGAPGADQRVGVFAGVSANAYLPALMADPSLVRSVGEYALTLGNQGDYLPTRVSYKLDLVGPSLNVQTACSTSLVAVHLAVRSLLAGECEIALAGGVCVRARERRGYAFEPGGIASPDGHCRAFDARAAGTVSGSGVGVVVLRRLADALADGDTVRAVILGSAINNDGARKVGFTAPSVGAQARAIRDAQQVAGVAPETITYVEAHGTGTPMGDPIEVAALTEAFAAGTAAKGFCALGSVKSNLGHLDAAAGVAGLIKTVLALEHREIPPTLHFERPNPSFELASTPFRVASELLPWASDHAPRRAGVSSFGIGGTNAHVVLEEAPAVAASGEAKPVQLLLLSAKTPSALDRMSERLASHLAARPAATPRELADVAFTLQVGRRALPCRRMVVCREVAGAVEALGGRAPERLVDRRERPERPAVAFLFPGQGAQYAGAAANLDRSEPVFQREIDRAAEVLAPELGVDLREVLFGAGPDADDRLADTRFTQPALFALEYALAKLWLSLGVTPTAMIGHSVGEYVAATLAEVFSFEDALRLVALRGRLMSEMPAGGMLAVAVAEDRLLPALRERGLDLAAVNGPEASVVSGEREALAALEKELTGRGVECRWLATSHAFHSRSMEPVAEIFAFEVMAVERRPPKVPFLSNVTGTWIKPEEAMDPTYWAEHLRLPVRFADGLGEILAEPGWLLLEVGPGRQLSTLARQHGRRSAAALVQTTLPHRERRGEDLEAFTTALGQLWLAGAKIDWAAHHQGGRRRVPLPVYPFEGKAYRAGVWHGGPAALSMAALAAADEPAVAAGTHLETGPPVPLSATEEAIAAIWREMLGVETIRREDDFFDLGGSSLAAIRLSARLEQALGSSLSLSALLESSTLRGLAARFDAVGAASGPVAPPCLVPIAPRGHLPPIFLVHQVGGQAFTFRALARALGPDQPLHAFRSLGLEAGEEPLGSIEEMAAHDLSLLRAVQPAGPYRLGGASMGGMVAFEMARQLVADGEEVALLALFDTPCGEQMPAQEGEAEAVAAVFAAHAGIRLDLAALRRLQSLEARLEHALAAMASAGEGAPPLDPATARRLVRVLAANAAALYSYQPKPYAGTVTLLRAAERRPGDPPRPELAWIELALGGLDFVLCPGNHLSMHEPPHVAVLARHLGQRLAAVATAVPALVTTR